LDRADTSIDNETILRKISETRKARLEIHHAHSVLRITADKTTAEYAANDIEEALQNTVTRKMQLRPWIPCLEENNSPKDRNLEKLYTQDDLDMVTSLTRTSIQKTDNANQVGCRSQRFMRFTD
jgi:hypothetical protein